MKIAYIILAYNRPHQLGRMIKKLAHEDAAFYIHIDKKSNFNHFKNILSELSRSAKITLLPRKVISWGGIGMINAALRGLAGILEDRNFKRIILISGQDYPIKPNDFIFNFFESNSEKNFISYFKLPYKEWDNGGMSRIENYHFRILGNKFTYPPLGEPIHLYSKLFYSLLKLRFRKPRQFPEALQSYGGFTWWRITDKAAREILNFVDRRPDYLKFHKYTQVVDEIFFQTILLNSKNDSLVNSIVNNDLTFIKWIQGNAHPEIITSDDFEALRSSDVLYARKFDTNIEARILDLIDEKLLSL